MSKTGQGPGIEKPNVANQRPSETLAQNSTSENAIEYLRHAQAAAQAAMKHTNMETAPDRADDEVFEQVSENTKKSRRWFNFNSKKKQDQKKPAIGTEDFTAGPKLHPSAYISTIFINLLALALPLVILQVYDRILPNQSKETLGFLILGLTGVVIVDTVMKIARSYLVGWAAAKHDFHVRFEGAKRVIYASQDNLANTTPSAILDKMNALDKMKDFYGGTSRLLLLDLPFVFVFLGLVWFIGGYLFLVPVALFLILSFVTMSSGRALKAIYERRTKHDDRRYDFIIEVLEGIATIKSMAMEPQMQRRFEKLQRHSASTNYQTILLSNISQTIGSMFANISMVCVVSVGAIMVINNQMSIGALAACTLLAGRTIQPLLRAVGLWTQIQTISVARDQVRELFELPKVEIADFTPLESCRGEIFIHNLSYGYEGAANPMFNNLNLEVGATSTIGIRGKDGEGKSTLLKLIMGEIQPVSGEILIDGRAIDGPQARSLQEHIAYVPQKSEIFDGTILENITIFRSGVTIDYARIAAQLIGLEDDIHRLPEGYDTRLGNTITNQLPEGFIQRIVIARALARAPSVLLFDEANGLLDRRNDRLLREGLEQLKGHMTIILVSNRPSLLELADNVYELANGKLQISPFVAIGSDEFTNEVRTANLHSA